MSLLNYTKLQAWFALHLCVSHMLQRITRAIRRKFRINIWLNFIYKTIFLPLKNSTWMLKLHLKIYFLVTSSKQRQKISFKGASMTSHVTTSQWSSVLIASFSRFVYHSITFPFLSTFRGWQKWKIFERKLLLWKNFNQQQSFLGRPKIELRIEREETFLGLLRVLCENQMEIWLEDQQRINKREEDKSIHFEV